MWGPSPGLQNLQYLFREEEDEEREEGSAAGRHHKSMNKGRGGGGGSLLFLLSCCVNYGPNLFPTEEEGSERVRGMGGFKERGKAFGYKKRRGGG